VAIRAAIAVAKFQARTAQANLPRFAEAIQRALVFSLLTLCPTYRVSLYIVEMLSLHRYMPVTNSRDSLNLMMHSSRWRFSEHLSETARIFRRLVQRPFPEACDLWYARSRLRPDDPISLGQSKTKIERPCQATVNQIPGCKCGAGKRNTLAIDAERLIAIGRCVLTATATATERASATFNF
jgi:hypothetical protein